MESSGMECLEKSVFRSVNPKASASESFTALWLEESGATFAEEVPSVWLTRDVHE